MLCLTAFAFSRGSAPLPKPDATAEQRSSGVESLAGGTLGSPQAAYVLGAERNDSGPSLPLERMQRLSIEMQRDAASRRRSADHAVTSSRQPIWVAQPAAERVRPLKA